MNLTVNAPWFGQFLLTSGPNDLPFDLPENWQSFTLGNHTLRVCPSVPCATGQTDTTQIVTLGCSFCGVEKKSPAEKAEEMARADWSAPDALPESVQTLVGRFLLFVLHEENLRILPDPTLSFHAFVGRGSSGQLYASSEIKLLRATKQFAPNASESWSWSLRQPRFQRQSRHPLDETDLAGVQMIPANHVWHLGHQEGPIRVFPFRKKTKTETEPVSSLMLKAITTASSNAQEAGYKIWFPITAGQDSRFIASAAMHGHAQAILSQPVHLYHIQKKALSPMNRVDLNHAHHLQQQGIDVVIFTEKSKAELTQLQYQPLRWHSAVGHQTFGLPLNDGNLFPRNDLFAMGHTAEILKNMQDGPDCMSGVGAAKSLSFPNLQKAIAVLDEWVKSVRKVAFAFGYRISEFLWWERQLSLFSGTQMHLANLTAPTWSPFNSWQIIEASLGLPLKERDHHTSRFFAKNIAEWSPVLTAFPYNPDRRTRSITILKKLRIYWLYRPLGLWWRWHLSGREQKREARNRMN